LKTNEEFHIENKQTKRNIKIKNLIISEAEMKGERGEKK